MRDAVFCIQFISPCLGSAERRTESLAEIEANGFLLVGTGPYVCACAAVEIVIHLEGIGVDAHGVQTHPVFRTEDSLFLHWLLEARICKQV